VRTESSGAVGMPQGTRGTCPRTGIARGTHSAT